MILRMISFQTPMKRTPEELYHEAEKSLFFCRELLEGLKQKIAQIEKTMGQLQKDIARILEI